MPKKAIQVQRLPDPHNMIARVRSRLSKNCAVRLSPFCDVIIAMRMQGIDYRSIEAWLIEQGPEHRISPPTIWRNLTKCNMRVELPYAEEMAERWGGRIDLDLARELSGQIVQQRQRVDRLVKAELERQQKYSGYHDKRIKGERETLASLIRDLNGMMKGPVEAAKEAQEASGLVAAMTMKLTKDAADVIKDMLLNGELAIGEPLH